RRDDPDVARHGHGAAAGRRAAGQVAGVRDDRRLAPGRRIAPPRSARVTTDSLLDLWRTALMVCVEVAAPFLVIGLVVGLAVAVVQTATQLQESVLTFVPKLAAALIVIGLAGHWMLDRLGRFTIAAFTSSSATTETPGSPDLAPPAGPT